jgi:hypothetical protein
VLAIRLRQPDKRIFALKGLDYRPSGFGLTMRLAATRRGRRGTIIVRSQPVGEGRAPLWQYLLGA